MKKIVLVLFVVMVGLASSAQEWKQLYEYDVLSAGIGMAPTQMRIDPATNYLWFTSKDRMFTYGEGVSEDIRYVDEGMPIIEYFAIKNGVVWMISWNSTVLGRLYSYDGSVVTHEADLGVMAYTIEFDNEDTLWIGSNSWDGIGVHGYKDGNYIYYNDMNSTIADNNVYHVLEDSYGRKWFSNYTPGSISSNGLVVWDENGVTSFHNYYQGYNLPQFNQIVKAVQSPVGTIWIATSNGIFRYDEVDEDWEQYNTDNSNMPANYVTDIQFDKSGRMWTLFKDKALAYSYNMTDWVIFDSTNSPLNFEGGNFGIRSFAIDTLDNIWTADQNYLYVYNANGFQGWLADEAFEKKDDLKIYPNPVSDYVFVQGNFPENTEALVYNMTGQLAGTFKLKDGKINLSALAGGQYVLKIVSDEAVYSRQIIKK